MALTTLRLVGDAIPPDATTLAYEAREALSEPYEVVVRFMTHDAAFSLEEAIRETACLVVERDDGPPRLFHGIVDEARFLSMTGTELLFEVVLRPSLWALARRESCRIFQEKTLIQIVQSVFEDAGFGDHTEWRLQQATEPRELVVQWRESHLAFVSRLLEELGIFYFFEHTAEGHKLVLGDNHTAFGLPDDAVPTVLGERAPGLINSVPGTGSVWDVTRTRNVRATRIQLRDYDFQKTQSYPEAVRAAEDVWPVPYWEYPARFTKGSEGGSIVAARLREARRDADVIGARSHAPGLYVGGPFAIEGTVEPWHSGTFVVTRLTTRGTQAVDGGSRDGILVNEVEAVPAETDWAPPRRTPRPRIRGVQTAIVTGSSQQEQSVHVDEFGRIKVRFYWDRQSQQDHTSSPWIRVSQVGLGGSMVLPRVGWEVSVAFLDGDPDRPVVLGRTYNAEKPPPYGLPATKTSGSLKSMSSPGGGGHNEVMLGDSGGGQGFSMHAQKDLNIIVQNDKAEEIGVDETRSVNTNTSLIVGADESIEVGGDQSIDVGALRSQTIKGDQSISVGGSDVTNAISNMVEKITGDRSYSVGADQITIQNGIRYQVKGSMKREVGAVELVGTTSTISDNIVGNLDETTSAIKVQASVANVDEKIGGSKTQTSLAAELHLTKADIAQESTGSTTNLVGGLHYQKLGGDFVVKAPMVTMLGAVGQFKAGGTVLKLGGGPVTLKGTKISVKGALVVKMSGSMKLGS